MAILLIRIAISGMQRVHGAAMPRVHVAYVPIVQCKTRFRAPQIGGSDIGSTISPLKLRVQILVAIIPSQYPHDFREYFVTIWFWSEIVDLGISRQRPMCGTRLIFARA